MVIMQNVSLTKCAQLVLGEWLGDLARYNDGVVSAKNTKRVEAIHQARVTSRRLRTGLSVFKHVLRKNLVMPKDALKKWRKSIRALAKELSNARDLDVQIDFLSDLRLGMKPLKEKAGISRMITVLKKARGQIQRNARDAARALNQKKTLNEIQSVLGQMRVTSTADSTMECRKHARTTVLSKLHELLGYEKYAMMPSMVAELHQMRIAAKRLRYTLECFEPLLGNEGSVFIKKVRKLQTALGRVHDFDVWLGQLPLAEKYLMEKYSMLRSDSYREFIELWRKLKRERTCQRLTKILS